MIENKKSSRINKIIIHLVLIIFCITCILPIIAIVSISFSDKVDLARYGYRLIPLNFDITAYQYIFRSPMIILNAYKISIIVTVLGSFLSLLVNSLIAYPLSRDEFKFRNKITLFIFFPMLFNGGLVPWYILISQQLHLKDTIWVLVLPSLASAWNVLLLRTYFSKIPKALMESASIDGANEIYVFFRIILPLSKPALATVGFLTSLVYWNDWWLALLFIENQDLLPLQYLLQTIMTNIQYLASALQGTMAGTIDLSTMPDENARMAMCILAAGPMLFMFQFFQKYFVKGLTVGSIKG